MIYENLWSRNGSRPGILLVAVTTMWVIVHVIYADVLILHDSWKHIFPVIYALTKNTTCGTLPAWLSTVDNGSPTLIYLISFSLTQIVRVPLIYLWSCMHPGVLDAMYMYKLQIYLTYLIFAASMYILGRVLYTNRLAAVYLFTATMFAGLCLDSAHSNQVVNELFWVPWMLLCGILYHRNRTSFSAPWLLIAATLFFCLQLLDHYPHLIALATAIGIALYLTLVGTSAIAWRRIIPGAWPAFVLLFATAAQLHIIKSTIAGYAPSLRSDLTVDPGMFGETGFVQPTAFLGTFLPLTFTTGFENFADSMGLLLQNVIGHPAGHMFIFKLDALLFYLGVVPTLFAIAFVLLPNDRTLKRGWIIFALSLLLVSLQQSNFYYLIYRIPFFDVFRGYFLYIVFVVFAVLIMSGYAIDRLMVMAPEQKSAIARRASAWFAALCMGSLVVLLVLATQAANSIELLRKLAMPFVIDVCLVVIGILVFWLIIRVQRPSLAAVVLVAGLALPQAVYFASTYGVVGVSVSDAYAAFGLDGQDSSIPVRNASMDPSTYRRKLCTTFAQCYLSYADTVSLNTDLQGTFLRSRDEPVFQTGLKRRVVEALTGLTHPLVWPSQHVVGFSNTADLVAVLNTNEGNISHNLRWATLVPQHQIARLGAVAGTLADPTGKITSMIRGDDYFSITYSAEAPLYINAAINYDPHWQATIEGHSIPIAKANLGGIVTRVPAGASTVRFEYRNPDHLSLFASRYVFLLLAIVAIIQLRRFTKK